METLTSRLGCWFQFHFFTRKALENRYFKDPIYRPASMLDVYEKFGSAFHLPLYVTEITIPGAGGAPTEGWSGPAIQAEVVANLYRLWFAAPRMAGITWWNLGDGTAVEGENVAQAGFLDKNMDPKPVYHALDKLINHQWKTQPAGKTDAAGKFALRGFFGKYTVEVQSPAGSGAFEIDHANDGPAAHKLVVGKKR